MKKGLNIKDIGNQNSIRKTKYLMVSCSYNTVDQCKLYGDNINVYSIAFIICCSVTQIESYLVYKYQLNIHSIKISFIDLYLNLLSAQT